MRNRFMTKPAPLQPLIRVGDGVHFQANAIVTHLLALCKQHRLCSLNSLQDLTFSAEDWEQFCQLIGYSVDGYDELSFISARSKARVKRKASQMPKTAAKPRPRRKK
jgi:hypothetical protein